MNIVINDPELKEMFDHAVYFHGHYCPAMPLGLRAGLLALRKLGVERARDKELFLISETSEGHAMSCFLDGVMVATGCTYGKGNCIKLHYGKLAFTLIDIKGGKKIRISVKPDFILEALKSSPFIAERKKGIPPQDVDPAIAEKAINGVMSKSDGELFIVGDVEQCDAKPLKGTFEAYPCSSCGEVSYAKWVRVKEGKFLCIPCSGYEEDYRGS